jgi:hypothetical protein
MTTAVEARTEVTQTVSVGDLVVTTSGVYRWAGSVDAIEGMSRVSYDLRNGGVPRISIEADMVAPADLDRTLNLKDPRIAVVKDKAGRPATWVGEWSAQVAGEEGKWVSWERTKRDAVQKVARRLAIRDWQANGGKAVEA